MTHRQRRVGWRQTLEHHILSLLDRAFPGVSGCAHRLLGTAVGRLVVAECSDPDRLVRLGAERFRAFAAHRGVRVTTAKAHQLVQVARCALPAQDATVARDAIAADLCLLATVEAQLRDTDAQLARLLPTTPFAVVTSTPGWGTIRAAATASPSATPHAGRRRTSSTAPQG